MQFPPAATSADPLAPALLGDKDKDALPKMYEKLYEVFNSSQVPDQYTTFVQGMTGAELRQTYYESLRADDPDKIWQRFVHHHEFNLEKAFGKFLSCLAWRAKTKHVNDVIMAEGDVRPNELIAGTAIGSEQDKREAEDYINLFKKGEIYMHGTDKKGRAICWINVGKHVSSKDQSSFEKYMLYHIETPRLFMPSLCWSTLMVFDMTGAGLKQIEQAPLKSMLDFFDNYYPWGIANIVVYNAPWVFGGVWRIIKNWIPGKDAGEFVHFAKSAKDMDDIIERHTIPKSMGGDDEWQYSYSTGDLSARAAQTKDAAGKAKALQERLDIGTKLEDLTGQWIEAAKKSADVDAILKQREEIIKEIRIQYWSMDPYVRARGIYDDWGMIKAHTG